MLITEGDWNNSEDQDAYGLLIVGNALMVTLLVAIYGLLVLCHKPANVTTYVKNNSFYKVVKGFYWVLMIFAILIFIDNPS